MKAFLAVLAFLASLASALPAQDVGLRTGVVPPPASVQDTSGAQVNITERYVGKRPTLFEFWATWCEICQALLPRMQSAQRRFGDRVDFVVVGVGVNQSLNSMKRHLAGHPMPFAFYYDNAGAAVRAYEAPATSYIVVVDGRGRVVYTGSGADQDIEAAIGRALPSSDGRR